MTVLCGVTLRVRLFTVCAESLQYCSLPISIHLYGSFVLKVLQMASKQSH